MKIGLTPRIEHSQYKSKWYTYEEELIDFLSSISTDAEIIFLNPSMKQTIIDEISLLVIPGGTTPGVDIIRDNFEVQFINMARLQNKNILGICRGAQLLCVMEDIKLVEVRNHVNKTRKLQKEAISMGKCFHKWGIYTLPQRFEILAQDAVDGSIEIFQSINKKELGIMAHPERIKENQDIAKKIGLFFNEA